MPGSDSFFRWDLPLFPADPTLSDPTIFLRIQIPIYNLGI